MIKDFFEVENAMEALTEWFSDLKEHIIQLENDDSTISSVQLNDELLEVKTWAYEVYTAATNVELEKNGK